MNLINPYIYQSAGPGILVPYVVFADDFADGILDTTYRWATSVGTGSITETGGKVQLSTPSGGDTRLLSKYALSFYNRDLVFSLEISASDNNCAFQFLGTLDQSFSQYFGLQVYNGNLQVFCDSFAQNSSRTYNSTNHKFIKVSCTTNHIKFYGSPDGITWTLLDDFTTTVPMAALLIIFRVVQFGGGGVNTCTFDNVLMTQSMTPSFYLGDDFNDNSLDAAWSFIDSGMTVTEQNSRLEIGGPPNNGRGILRSIVGPHVSAQVKNITKTVSGFTAFSLLMFNAGSTDGFVLNHDTSNGNLEARDFAGILKSLQQQPYHVYVKVEYVNGIILFEVSEDNVYWWNVWSKPVSFTPGLAGVQLHNYGSTVSNQFWAVDDFVANQYSEVYV